MKKSLFLFVALLGFYFAGKGQIIAAPFLQCGVDSNNNNITLHWSNPPVNNCGAFVQYTIYASQSGPNGPYNPIAVTDQAATSYTLVGYLLTSNDWYFYMDAVYNCPGSTSLPSDTISNHAPITAQIINVTVTGGQAIFNWQPSISPQTLYYVIYNYNPASGQYFPLDTVRGRYTTTYTDTRDNPDVQSLSYSVSAVDSCTQISAHNTSPQNTIFMNAHVVQCQRQISMSWNKYVNWPQGVKEYQVWVSRNDSAIEMDGSVDSSTLAYSYTHFNDGDTLCFVVRAVSAADTTVISNSNQVCFKASIVQPPGFIYITNITVDAFNHIDVTWYIDTLAQLVSYQITQSTDGTTFVPINNIGIPSPFVSFEEYIDSFVSPQNNPFYYQVIAVDSCTNQYPSQPGVSINLQGQLYDFYVADLTWNEFTLFGATVLHYNLYRDFGTGYQLIKTLPDNTGNYIDSLQQFLNARGVFCYKVEAVYSLNLPNGYHAIDSSWSNEVCIIHHPIIYIPNAFAPNGLNNIFKPTIIYGDPQGYTMTIYNRWGGEIFESNDLTVGWDGYDHGKMATEGGYAYIIKFTADDGVVITRQGIVLLVR